MASGGHDDANASSLERFVRAQDDDGTYDRALREVRSGRKRTHWMWFVFPQLTGLGSSPMAVAYGLDSIDQARAYLDHPVLGPRLVEITGAVLDADAASAVDLLGEIDAKKLRSSATLFASVANAPAIFGEVIDRYFDGVPDPLTVRALGR